MKNVKILAVMAIAMVFAATMISCSKDFDNVSKSTLPQVPNDVEMTWRAMGNTDSVRVVYPGGSFVAAAPRMNGGNTYMRQGSNALAATGDTTVALTGTTASVVFAHNYGISDTISVDLGIDVVVMRWNPATGQTEPSNEKVYPAEAMGIFENIEKTNPQEAQGFYEINAMRYTLAEVSNPSLMAGRVSSKATIYELSSDTVVVTDTVIVTDTTNGGSTPTDPTVISRSVYWRHMHDCGQWSGTGATRNITLHCWCVETTNWSDGSTTKDSVLVAGHGTMTWNFPTYDHSVDGNYSASASGCSALQATCNVSYNYDVANIQGRTYTHGTACGPMPTAVNVNGTTATVATTANPNILRQATYSLTIVTPTPQDTVTIFGNIKYVARHYSAVDYYCGAAGDGWYILVIDENNNWYTSPDASSASGLNFTMRGTLTASEYAHIVSVSNFTAADMSGNRRCAAWCRNSTAGATANVISVVEYHPNGGNPQIKYRNMSGALIGVCSAATGTIEGHTVPEPVSWGGVMTSFTLGGGVIK